MNATAPQLFESKPRWPGAPLICLAANLPAFESKSALKAYHDAHALSCSSELTWQCLVCGQWHEWTLPPDPAGASSGTGRNSKRLEKTDGMPAWLLRTVPDDAMPVPPTVSAPFRELRAAQHADATTIHHQPAEVAA